MSTSERVKTASENLDSVARHARLHPHDLRIAALEYAYAIASEIKFLDGGEFQRTLDNILGTIISTARRRVGVPLP